MLKAQLQQIDLLCERSKITVSDWEAPIEPLRVSPWIAISLLQKSIRRGESKLALRAAATLRQHDPQRLLRRLCLTAFADVGMSGIPLLAPMIATMTNRARKKMPEADWVVVKKLILAFSKSHKCRMIADLLMVAEFHPNLAELRNRLLDGSPETLATDFREAENFEQQAAVLLAYHRLLKDLGIPRRAVDFQAAFNITKVVFHLVSELGAPTCLVDACHVTYTKTKEPLVLLFPLVFSARDTMMSVVDDPVPAEAYWNDVPLWAVDKFTCPGMSALSRFLETDCKTAKWVNQNCPKDVRMDVLGRMVFAVEGGQMRKRLSWPLADKFRETSQRECLGHQCPDATEPLAFLPSEIPLLNELRLQCLT